MAHRGQSWQNAKIRKWTISREQFVVRRRCLVILIGLETAFDVIWHRRICVGKIRKYEMVKCEIFKIAIYLVNIAKVDEKVKSLIGNQGRSFRIRHFLWTNANYRKTDSRMHRWALTQRVRWAFSCFYFYSVDRALWQYHSSGFVSSNGKN